MLIVLVKIVLAAIVIVSIKTLSDSERVNFVFMNTSTIYKDYSDKLYHFILSRTQNETVSKDLLQEVFLKVHLKIDSLKDVSKLKSWIFSIASNTVNDYFRKNKIEPPAFNDKDIHFEDESLKDAHSFQNCLIPHIKNLPPHYKEAVYMSEIKGMKQAEVAKKLGLSLSGAKSRIQRGRDLLREGYMNCCDYKINEEGFLVGEHKDISECKVCN